MMQDVQLDSSGDLAIIGGDAQLTTDEQEDVRQQVQCRLEVLRGQWALDVTLGVPWLDQVLGAQSPQAAAVIIAAELAKIERVIRVERLTASRDPATRELSVAGLLLISDADGALIAQQVTLSLGDDGTLALLLEATGGF